MNDTQKEIFIIKLGKHKIYRVYLADILIVINILFNIYLPTSHNKVIYGVNRLIFVWVVLLLEIIILMINNRVHTRRLFLSMFGINGYMFIATIIAKNSYPDARVSLARIIPILSLIILCSMKIENYPNINFLRGILNFVSISTIIWNTLIILKIPQIIDFTYNNYNQYYESCGFYQLVLGHKPVMSFGVHTYASYSYFLLFILCYATYRIQSKTIYMFYCFMYALFCLFCVSTTSVIFFLIMILVIVNDLRRSTSVSAFILIIASIAVGILIFYLNFNDLFYRVYQNFTGGGHGFSARYSSRSVFVENLNIIRSSLGIGYNIISSLEVDYSDSGYIVYLTMGNVPLMVTLYYNIKKYIDDNIQLFKKLVLIAVFGFEFGLPGTFNYRFSYFIIFVAMYLGALMSTELPTYQDSEFQY